MLGLRTRSGRNQSRVYRGSPQLFVPIAAASSFIAAKAKPMMQRQGAMRPFSSPAFPGRDLRLLPFDRRPRSSCSNLALVAITPQAPRWALIAVCAVPARISRRAFLVPNASFARQRRRARAYHAMLRHLNSRSCIGIKFKVHEILGYVSEVVRGLRDTRIIPAFARSRCVSDHLRAVPCPCWFVSIT